MRSGVSASSRGARGRPRRRRGASGSGPGEAERQLADSAASSTSCAPRSARARRSSAAAADLGPADEAPGSATAASTGLERGPHGPVRLRRRAHRPPVPTHGRSPSATRDRPSLGVRGTITESRARRPRSARRRSAIRVAAGAPPARPARRRDTRPPTGRCASTWPPHARVPDRRSRRPRRRGARGGAPLRRDGPPVRARRGRVVHGRGTARCAGGPRRARPPSAGPASATPASAERRDDREARVALLAATELGLSDSVDPRHAIPHSAIAQHELLHLARRGLRQLAELDRVGALEAREPLPAEGDQLGLGRAAPVRA